jgi:hypothetical protein
MSIAASEGSPIPGRDPGNDWNTHRNLFVLLVGTFDIFEQTLHERSLSGYWPSHGVHCHIGDRWWPSAHFETLHLRGLHDQTRDLRAHPRGVSV